MLHRNSFVWQSAPLIVICWTRWASLHPSFECRTYYSQQNQLIKRQKPAPAFFFFLLNPGWVVFGNGFQCFERFADSYMLTCLTPTSMHKSSTVTGIWFVIHEKTLHSFYLSETDYTGICYTASRGRHWADLSPLVVINLLPSSVQLLVALSKSMAKSRMGHLSLVPSCTEVISMKPLFPLYITSHTPYWIHGINQTLRITLQKHHRSKLKQCPGIILKS